MKKKSKIKTIIKILPLIIKAYKMAKKSKKKGRK